jgi:hypothetical protein
VFNFDPSPFPVLDGSFPLESLDIHDDEMLSARAHRSAGTSCLDASRSDSRPAGAQVTATFAALTDNMCPAIYALRGLRTETWAGDWLFRVFCEVVATPGSFEEHCHACLSVNPAAAPDEFIRRSLLLALVEYHGNPRLAERAIEDWRATDETACRQLAGRRRRRCYRPRTSGPQERVSS